MAQEVNEHEMLGVSWNSRCGISLAYLDDIILFVVKQGLTAHVVCGIGDAVTTSRRGKTISSYVVAGTPQDNLDLYP